MSKNRIYVKELKGEGDYLALSKENSKIVKSVLRLRKGDEIELVDGEGALYFAHVAKVGKEGCHVTIYQRGSYPDNNPNKITLLQAFPKGKRTELIIQKVVELGVDRIIFFPAERSVAVVKKDKSPLKLSRMEKIIVEALRQSKRLYKPEIVIAQYFHEIFKIVKNCDLKLLLHEDQKGEPIKGWLSKIQSPKDIAFAIGPEGGFSEKEAASFINEGFHKLKLGEEILRTDTAPIAVMSILNYEFRW